MIVFHAICITQDPEKEDSGNETETLGIFSELKYAKKAFNHSCFRGEHSIYEHELDKKITAHFLLQNNEWIEYRRKQK